MLEYISNRYRQKGFINGLKGEFSLAAMKNLNPHSENKLIQTVLDKAEEFLCQEDVAGLFDTACYSNNVAVIQFSLDMHLQNIDLMEQDKLPTDSKNLPLLLTADTVIDGLMTAIEHGNIDIVKELVERADDWIYCQTEPEQFEDFTSDEYWDVQFFSPLIYALRQMDRHEETQGAKEVKTYLKTKHNVEAGLDHASVNEEAQKPSFTLIKGGISTPKDDTVVDKAKPRPNYIKPV